MLSFFTNILGVYKKTSAGIARSLSSPRQYDFFSLLFENEDKENATAIYEDDDTETDPTNGTFATTSEKSFLDALREGLDYIEINKDDLPSSPGTDAPLGTTAESASQPTEGDDDDDDEEVSILDFLLNGEKALVSSKKNSTYNATDARPVEAFTNSPMQIRPLLPETAKNETIKFAMLPMSLYNMIKEDGTIVFEGNANSTEIEARVPNVKITAAEGEEQQEAVFNTTTTTHRAISNAATISPSVASSKIPLSTASVLITSTESSKKAVSETTEAASPTKSARTEKISSSVADSTQAPSTTETKVIQKLETVTQKAFEATPNATEALKMSTSSAETSSAATQTAQKTSQVALETSTKESEPSSTTKLRELVAESRIVTSVVKPPTTAMPKRTTTLQTTVLATTTTTTAEPKTTVSATARPVEMKSNPSILESDINYDYGEPTLPPSLPNLKIIPFLPTDAVKGIEAYDRRKSNYHYSSNSKPYSRPTGPLNHSPYSPFNIKPTTHKYPPFLANSADDRLDYDSYKPTGSVEEVAIDYGNVYAVDSVNPPIASAVVDSKIDYSPYSNKGHAKPTKGAKFTTTTEKSPPIEHHYVSPYDDLFNYGQQDNNFDYDSEAPGGDVFAHDHDYPDPAEADPVRPPTPFGYSGKSKFSPPLKTEGMNLNFCQLIIRRKLLFFQIASRGLCAAAANG